jgi:hypothetical protein
MKMCNRVLLSALVWLALSVQAAPQTEGTATTTATAAQASQLQQYFFAAARTGEISVLQYFIEAGYPVNAANPQSYTALMVAAYSGQAEAVQLLLAAGADACLRDKRGHTALMGAMIKAEWAIARTLYAKDCDAANPAAATAAVTDKQQMTAAQFAQIFGQSEKFQALTQSVAVPTEVTTATAKVAATAAAQTQPR